MADARSLLRQQRAARRIEHPHAIYSELGKLTCSVCREGIKSEALWEGHIRSLGHRQRLIAHQKAKASAAGTETAAAGPTSGTQDNMTSNGGGGGGVSHRAKSSTDTLSDEALLAQIIGGAGQKRKHGEDEDVEMPDAVGEDEVSRKKRSRPGPDSPAVAPTSSATDAPTTTTTTSLDSPASAEASKKTPSMTSPPGLVRRISGTPSHGVELQIPSRPATPSAASTTSTPKATSVVRSPLAPQERQMASLPAVATSKPAPRAAFATSSLTAAGPPSVKSTTTGTAANEDDDWAAFMAEVVNTAPPPNAPADRPATTDTASVAVISAKPMTAEEIASKAEEEEQEKRKAQADIEIEDEKEEATRALEAEFEEMEELEARVRKLKEKREALRRGSVPAVVPTAAATSASTMATPDGKGTTVSETKQPVNGAAVEDSKKEDDDDEDEDEDDEEEDDDWAGFRFRA